MGMANNEGKEVVLADDKVIKKSNIINHFLFKKDNLSFSKSEYACKAIKK